MRFELKPLSFGEVLDGSLKVFRANLGVFLTISLVFNVPTVLATAWMQSSQQGLKPGDIPPGFVPQMILMMLGGMLVWAVTTAAAVQVIMGEPISVGGAIKRLLSVFGAMLVAVLLMGIIGTLCTLALVIPGVIYFLGRALFLPVLLVEGGSGANALKRSKQLVGKIRKGRMDRMFGASLVFGILTWALSWGAGMLIPAGLKTTFIGAALGVLPQVLVAPLFQIAVVLIYFDARVRDEGYDLELRAKEAGLAPGPA